jgi:site-specific recombinase XerD
MTNLAAGRPGVQFTLVRERGQLRDVVTDSPAINHFLRVIKLGRSHNTWVSYAHDLKLFFAVVAKPPEAVDRQDCLTFIEQQDRAGHATTTVNRRLAALSSLFGELQLYDPDRFTQNVVQPLERGLTQGRRVQRYRPSLYRRQPARVPDIIAAADLRRFFDALPSWRDRTLMLLMWISCLRISEAVGIRFGDIECSRRSIRIGAAAKGGRPRTVYVDHLTFAALNRYLDAERAALFPEMEAVFVAFRGRARGQPLSANAVQHLLAYHARRCGVAALHAHLFRHTGITQLLQQGMAEPVVRALVGHRRPESLLPYIHLCDTTVETEFARAQAGLDLAWVRDSVPTGGAG